MTSEKTTGSTATTAQRLSRPPKPDRDEFERKIAALKEITEAKQRRIEEIKSIVNAKKGDRQRHNDANAPLIEKFKALNAIANEKIAQRNTMREAMNASTEARDKAREEANAQRNGSKFLTNEAIDAEITRVENKLAHETMPLSEEKRLIDVIKGLNKSRDGVKSYAEKQAVAAAHEVARKSQMDKIKAKDAEINSIKAEQSKIRATLDGDKSKIDEKNADVPSLTEEKNAVYQEIKKVREDINKLYAEQKIIEDAYWVREKASSGKRNKRNARLERRLESKEVSACDTLIGYLSKWDMSASKENDAPAGTTGEGVTKALESMTLLKRDDDDDDMFAVSDTYKKKGKKNGNAKGPKNELIQHSLDTLAFFSKIKVAVVAKASEVPSAIVAIQAKKEEFLEKRRIKKEKIAAGEDSEEEGGVDAEEAEAKDEKSSSKKHGKKNGKRKGGSSHKQLLTVSLIVGEDECVTVTVTVNERTKK
ncbi:hypothetical protein BE221DRAFT_78638 [Ostreococcus tauri]|uniref:Uncharacterized protein n=1 Tax=Ostreococcus tauri TaxID=70448 RepID=A0A1Y5I2Q8_OSTTA|nr:hypothetical protein BE221DRAFT_78638 [Ostreococcus tauri]